MGRLVLIVALVLAGCSPVDLSTNEPATDGMEYRVSGTASRVSLTYESRDGATEQIASAALPWSYTFKGYAGKWFYISVQNNGSSGTVIVECYRNGSVYKSAQSSGAYVIASIDGAL